MSFGVPAESYDSFMGRYSTRLAPAFATFAEVAAGQLVLDVGCGPGALTAELVGRLGAAAVTAVDPSEPFVAAVRRRLPGVTVELAPAEHLPFAYEVFDATLAQLVVHFMADPVAGLREMARVTRAHGVVAACVWDHASSRGPLGAFWQAARALDATADDESERAGTHEGQLKVLFQAAGIHDVQETSLTVTVEHPTFDEWWLPFTLGVGPAGAFTAGLGADDQARLRDLCRQALPAEPFTVTARAWAAKGRA
jgi:SAM-dependent methyltransferase